MKPLLMRHSEPINESLKVWRNHKPYRHNPWHYHPECEITYIYEGEGVLFIGDRMIEYGNNDVVLMGPNLPHEWRSKTFDTPDLLSESISIHFSSNFLGEHFYKLPETSFLVDFLKQSRRGIKIEDWGVKSKLKVAMRELVCSIGISKIYKLLEILHILFQCPNKIILSSNSFIDSIEYDHDNWINHIYEYVMENLTREISVGNVASVINMTETSFCRFFKERTHKSFITYLNEVRVGYACRLLLDGKRSVAEVAYESGFGNMSNFNKQFKKVKSVTPTRFRKNFLNH